MSTLHDQVQAQSTQSSSKADLSSHARRGEPTDIHQIGFKESNQMSRKSHPAQNSKEHAVIERWKELSEVYSNYTCLEASPPFHPDSMSDVSPTSSNKAGRLDAALNEEWKASKTCFFVSQGLPLKASERECF